MFIFSASLQLTCYSDGSVEDLRFDAVVSYRYRSIGVYAGSRCFLRAIAVLKVFCYPVKSSDFRDSV
ncbi:hypothetical protein L1987_47093 [Smallanthus sonchifolius]|uniref:Uncharacterized protein n=1 Tax=Smallanthus sonchifolius TaxID=185202 RepID=A0ACB9G0Z1_9ASTR|nr:hypothetical protein L1987_47093 [Smallanthus sonchifolius]